MGKVGKMKERERKRDKGEWKRKRGREREGGRGGPTLTADTVREPIPLPSLYVLTVVD